MPTEPTVKRAVIFIDGQNLFYAAKATFGYSYPNYDPKALAEEVCQKRGWQLVQTRIELQVNANRLEKDQRGLDALGRVV